MQRLRLATRAPLSRLARRWRGRFQGRRVVHSAGGISPFRFATVEMTGERPLRYSRNDRGKRVSGRRVARSQPRDVACYVSTCACFARNDKDGAGQADLQPAQRHKEHKDFTKDRTKMFCPIFVSIRANSWYSCVFCPVSCPVSVFICVHLWFNLPGYAVHVQSHLPCPRISQYLPH